MFFPHIDLILPETLSTEYKPLISHLIEGDNKLHLQCKPGQYVAVNNTLGDELEKYHNGISISNEEVRVYITRTLVRRGLEYNSSSGTETLHPLEVLYLIEDLSKLPATEKVIVHDYVRPEKVDRVQGYTVREGRIQMVSGEIKAIADLPLDYYTNINRTRWEGRKWTTLYFKFLEQRVREV